MTKPTQQQQTKEQQDITGIKEDVPNVQPYKDTTGNLVANSYNLYPSLHRDIWPLVEELHAQCNAINLPVFIALAPAVDMEKSSHCISVAASVSHPEITGKFSMLKNVADGKMPSGMPDLGDLLKMLGEDDD